MCDIVLYNRDCSKELKEIKMMMKSILEIGGWEEG